MSSMATVDKPPKKDTEKGDKKPGQSGAASSPLENLGTYLKGVRTEWTKISWPTPPQIMGQTLVVLVMVSIMTLGLFLIDNTFRLIIDLITPNS